MFVAERQAVLLDEKHLTVLARQHGIKKAKDNESIEKLFVAFLRRSENSTLGRILVETFILQLASRRKPSQFLKDGAAAYKVNRDAIALKVRQEFSKKSASTSARNGTKKPIRQTAA